MLTTPDHALARCRALAPGATLGEVFRAHGYRTALYGKWHLGGNFRDFQPHERGFDDAVHFLRGGVQSHPNRWNSDLMDDEYLHNGRYEAYEGYATDVWFELGSRFVRRMRAQGEPFFLYLPLNAPHAPLLVPDRLREGYEDLPKNEATFFGMIRSVDEALGRFLRLLEEEGLAGDTILVFLTDNGTAYGETVFTAGMRGKKSAPYEGGHRVPLFIRWPGGGLRSPADIDALVQVQDILPTLVDLCALDPPKGPLDGTSLAPLLRGQLQPELEDRILVVQTEPRENGRSAVLWGRWRLVNRTELYDLARDPGQTHDLAKEDPEILERLAAHHESWWRGVEPHLDLERYRIARDGVPTKLTAYDWAFGPRVYNWPHLRRGDRGQGRYLVTVSDPGRYRIALRRWPRESGAAIRSGVPGFVPFDDLMTGVPGLDNFPPGVSQDIRKARVRVGEREQTHSVRDGDQGVHFFFDLERGDTDLQTWFIDGEGGAFGAYYVYIETAG